LIQKPELGYIPPSVRNRWMSSNNRYRKEFKPTAVPYLLTSLIFLKKLTKAFHEAGVTILLGTDAAEDQPFMLPGFSIHDELQELVSAGLSPFEAIKAGTSNAANLLSPSQEFGTVATGKRADLILVERNPFEDVANIKRRVGVMLRGRWMPEEELKSRLADLRAAYAGN
jgi:imidazolonepropionase-like amidohydrolase